MILIHITSVSEQQINEIIDLLVNENLVLHPIILEKTHLRKKNSIGTFENEQQFLAMAKARALLFGEIENLLKKKYKEKMPDLYSLPIVNMDWKKAEGLKKRETKNES